MKNVTTNKDSQHKEELSDVKEKNNKLKKLIESIIDSNKSKDGGQFSSYYQDKLDEICK